MTVKKFINARIFSGTIAIGLLAFVVQLGVVVRFSHSGEFVPQGDDMRFYADWAMRIAAGELTDGKAFYGLPGYPYLLAAIFKVMGFDPFTVGLLQAALFAGVAMVLYRLALEMFAIREDLSSPLNPTFSKVASGLAALGWIIFLPAQTFSAILMPTVWLVFTYWGCVLWLVRTPSSSWAKPWPLLGAIIGVVAMLVATILFLIPLVLVAIIRSVARGQPWRVRALHIGAAVALFVAGLFAGSSPAWIHNRFLAREPVMLSAHSGINMWIGNNPTANGYPRIPPGLRASQQGLLKDSITLAESAAGRHLTRTEVSAFWNERAREYIRSNFQAWLALVGKKFANFWNAYQYDDICSIKLLRDQGVTWPGLRFGVVAALGLAGMAFAWRCNSTTRWIAAAVLLHMLALMPVFVTERYRLAAVPGLLLLGSWFLFALWQEIAHRRWAMALAMAAVASLAAWFVSIPRPDPGLWSLDHYKAGIRATVTGDLDRAERNLETARAYSPKSADIQFALGNVCLARGDRTRAKEFYRVALDLDPQHEGVLNNLGVLAFEEKRWELAERFLLGSLKTEPDDPETLFLLARTRLERGDRDGARRALAEAIRLRPGVPEMLDLQQRLDVP